MDRIHEKAHDMMAFLVAIENPVTNIFRTTLSAMSPQIHPPSGVQHRGKLIYQYSVGVPHPPLYLVLGAYLLSRPYRFDILSAIDNYQIPGRILLKSVFDLLTLLTDFVHHHHR